MYSEMKIQLFIDIVNILKKDYEYDSVKVKGENIEFGGKVLSIKEDSNIISFTIVNTVTLLSVVKTIAWFELESRLEQIMSTLIYDLKDLIEMKKVAIMEGIVTAMNTRYSMSDKDIENTNEQNISFRVRDKLKITFSFESNIVCSEAYIDSGTTIRLTNNMKDFTPAYLLQIIIPMIENLYKETMIR